jgi:hypothetical protein
VSGSVESERSNPHRDITGQGSHPSRALKAGLQSKPRQDGHSSRGLNYWDRYQEPHNDGSDAGGYELKGSQQVPPDSSHIPDQLIPHSAKESNRMEPREQRNFLSKLPADDRTINFTSKPSSHQEPHLNQLRTLNTYQSFMPSKSSLANMQLHQASVIKKLEKEKETLNPHSSLNFLHQKEKVVSKDSFTAKKQLVADLNARNQRVSRIDSENLHFRECHHRFLGKLRSCLDFVLSKPSPISNHRRYF